MNRRWLDRGPTTIQPRVEEMTDLDKALHLLQNKIRRQILERLIREPHYPMQLAELIGVSQPAIVKHLKELERGQMVSKSKVPSEKGGPPKTIYAVEQAFSIHIDLGPDLFRCEQRRLPAASPIRLASKLPERTRAVAEALGGRRKIAVGEGLEHLRTLAEALDELDAQRDAIISLHQHVRQRVSAGVEADFEHYEERSIIQSIVESNGAQLDLNALLKHHEVGERELYELVDTLSAQLERQLAKRAGHIVAAPLNTDLRYFLGLGTNDARPNDGGA